jgi:hypothetical protein
VTRQELKKILDGTPRELSADQVERLVRQRDEEQGEYIGRLDHHEYGEARH